MRSVARCLGPAVAVVLLAGCGIPLDAGDRSEQAPAGPTREHWRLSLRVPQSPGVRVVGQRVDAFSESLTVSFDRDAGGADVECSVTVSTPGWGGPENKVGEKVPTTVQGRPAVRNGAGAEGDYLIWQRADGAWMESICRDDGQVAFQDRLAEIVTDDESEILLPFDVTTLPPGTGVSGIEQDLRSGETKVYLDGLLLSYDVELARQEGRPTVIGGHPASVDETPRDPGLCLTVQGHDVCVGIESSDTGPYPDRSDELPVMTAIAESLRFPSDLTDRSSWFPAQDVFG